MIRNVCIRLSMLVLVTGLAGCGAKNIAPTPDALPVETEVASSPTPEVTAVPPTPTEDPSGWEVVLRTEPVNAYSTMVAGFLDEAHGILAGLSGEIHYSLDGGINWPRAENNTACRFGLDIVDAQIAWSVGNNGNVSVSKDGGQTWQMVTNTPWRAHLVRFLDDTTGWAAGVSSLVATGDGGETWNGISLPEGVRKIAAIDLRTAVEGYLLDDTGGLHVTQDGGKTWNGVSLLGLDKKILAGESMPLAAIRFTDSAKGIVVAGRINSNGELTVLQTSDGGKTWDRSILPAKLGALFLTHDARFLTVLGGDNRISVLRNLR
jgi:photosystem II stability/assembly factor-like uncharacterized protein